MSHDILEKTNRKISYALIWPNAQNVFDNKYIIVFRVNAAI